MSVLEAPVPGASVATRTTDPAVFDKAADLIEKHGWAQRVYGGDPMGLLKRRRAPMCLVGALRVALADAEVDKYSLTGRAELAAEEVPGVGRRSPYSWNDQVGRTKQEVVARLRDAAATARKTL